MLDQLLQGILGTVSGPGPGGEEKGEKSNLLGLIILFVVIIGGLKLLRGKDAGEPKALEPPSESPLL